MATEEKKRAAETHRGGQTRAWGKRATAALVLLASLVGVSYARPKLAERLSGVKDAAEIYALPPPEALPALSLGYRSAMADWLFTKAIISHAMHAESKRRFDAVADYLEAIIALDPTLRDTYRYADSLIVYHAVGEPTPELIRRAWRILETGLELRPGDAQLWLSTGQFMAFIAPQWLKDKEEKAAFKALGAQQLARASELADESSVNVLWQSLAAVGVFTKAGERQAAIGYLERAFMVTDNEEMREQIAARLAALRQDAEVDRVKAMTKRFNDVWQKDLAFVSRTKFLVLGPSWDAASCAGQREEAPGCAQSWAKWSATVGE